MANEQEILNILFKSEFQLPVDGINNELFIPNEVKDKVKGLISVSEANSSSFALMKKQVLLGEKIDEADQREYEEAITKFTNDYGQDFIVGLYINRINRLKRQAELKKDEAPELLVEVLSEFRQRMNLLVILKDSKPEDLTSIYLYYCLMVDMINDPNVKVYDIIKDSGFRFLLLDDDSVDIGGEKTEEEKAIIVDKLRTKQNKNLFHYIRQLREHSNKSNQKEIRGQFNTSSITPIDENEVDYDIKKISYNCTMSVEDAMDLIYSSRILKYIDDKELSKYKDLFDEKRLSVNLNMKRISPIEIIRLKNLGVVSEEKVQELFKDSLDKRKYDNENFEENRINQAVVGIYLGHLGKKKRKTEFKVDYLQYKELFEKNIIGADKFIQAIQKGWIDKKSIIRLIADGYIQRDEALEAVAHSPRPSFDRIQDYDYETQLLAWSMGLISVNDLENYLENSSESVDRPSNVVLSQIAELIDGDFNRISSLLTTFAIDYTSMVEVINASRTKDLITERQRKELFDVVLDFRLEQLSNQTNAVKIKGNGKPSNIQSIRGLNLDPYWILEFFANVNDSKSPNVGDLKRLLIDGIHLETAKDKDGNVIIDPGTGKPKKVQKKGSLHGYEVIPLPELKVAVLEKTYKTKRVEKLDENGNKFYKMEYEQDENGELIPDTVNNATYVVPIEMAIDFSQHFNKKDLIDSPLCFRQYHNRDWVEGVVACINKIIEMRNKPEKKTEKKKEDKNKSGINLTVLPHIPEENFRTGTAKLGIAVKNYIDRIKANYDELLPLRGR